ncbi:hypothetical protein BGZ54_005690 [Gamsiella multidivaricata]|nr:hypothetical protein BGZ54_005690 [Gamsiella multidivaricata]
MTDAPTDNTTNNESCISLKATRNPLAQMVPHELLVKIFYNLEERPQHRYYAAVDTLWREVDLQSVESFIQFSRVLDPGFSYMDTEPTIVYSPNGYREQGRECKEGDDYATTTEHDVRERGHGQLLHAGNATHLQHKQPVRSGFSEVSSRTPLSEQDISSLSCSPTPGLAGYAGKGYIRSFSLAGTSNCQVPRPSPYLPSCINDRHLIAISSLTHLTSLSIHHCTALTDLGAIQLITASSPYLKRINLTGCRRISNLTVQVIAQLCSQLEDLSLQECGLVTDDAIEELAYHCTRLQKVNIGQCHRVTDRALLALLKSSGRMVQLDPASKARTRNARLTKLSVAGCHGITLKGLLAIAECLSDKQLEETDLDGSGGCGSSLVSLTFTYPPLKNTALSTMANAGPVRKATRLFPTLPTTLEEITVFDAFNLTHDDVVCLVGRIGPRLKSLRLDNANAIRSETLALILNACPNLTVLCIPRATQLDDAGVIQLATAKCAQSLVELDLSACHGLTDACLTKLAKSHLQPDDISSPYASLTLEDSKGKGVQERKPPGGLFPNLRRLDLSYNHRLTLSGIIPLVMSLKNLCTLDASFCGGGVTRSWFESLQSILDPAVTTINSSSDNENLQDGSSTDSGAVESAVSPLSSSAQSCQHEEQQQESGHLHQTTNGASGMDLLQPSALIQNLQQLVDNAIPQTIPSRAGLGRYVGPLLNRPTATFQNNDQVPQHPQQYPGQGVASTQEEDGEGSQQYGRRSSASSVSSSSSTSSASSTASSSSSSSSFSSLLSEPLPLKEIQQRQPRRHSYPRSRLPLSSRHDILENTLRRVGVPASLHLESWFTPQHQQQLQQLHQIQLQHQRDVQDQLAANGNQVDGSAIQGTAILLPELMEHPVMMAPRPGVATIQADDEPPQRWLQQSHFGRRRGSVGNIVVGSCEISAWGLAKLREEWTMPPT